MQRRRLTCLAYCHLLMKGALKKRLDNTAMVPRLRGLNQAADTHLHKSIAASWHIDRKGFT